MKVIVFSLLVILTPSIYAESMVGLATKTASPYALLGIPENASDSYVLGVPHVSQYVLNQIKIGLGTYATISPIQRSYWNLKSIWHPDVIATSSAQETLKKFGLTTPEEQKLAAQAVMNLLSSTFSKYNMGPA